MNYRNGLFQAFLRMLGLVTVFTAFVGGAANAQNIRLRAKLDPFPNNNSLSKYADITADGNIAVMGSYSTRGAFIFDVSNPDAPILKAHYNPGNNLQFLEAVVVGNRAYFGSGNSASGTGGVHIVDISDPSNPVLLGRVSAAIGGYDTIHEMVVDGNYLYINSNSTGNRPIKVINISNPAQPVFVRDINLNNTGWVHAVYIRNGKMYTSGFTGNGLTEIWDITDIEAQPARFIGQVVSGSNSHSSWTSEDGNYLYVCREFFDGELRVYDIRDLSQPLLVKVIKAADLGINAICPHNPIVKGNRLYVAWYQAGVQVFDISNPADPKRIGQFDTYTPQYSETEARAQMDSAGLEPDELICGSETLAAAIPTGYNGNWTAYPLLGEDKVLLADLATGLYVVDASSLSAAPANDNADFDGDGKTDFSVFTKQSGVWTIENSSNNATIATQFGVSTDTIRPSDWDGDRKTDIAVFRAGEWYILDSSTNSFRAFYFGQAGDIPVSADYDSDGKTDAAVFRPSDGVWYIMRSTLGFAARQWGLAGDEPVTGDFDGDGKSDLAVTRAQNGYKVWYVLQSTSSIPQYVQFGLGDDKTIVADFDGDARTDKAVYRASEGTWYVLNSQTNAMSTVQFGVPADVPIAADYDGDSKADIAVYRPSTRVWYGLRSQDNSFFAREFGGEDDVPTPAAAQLQQ